MPIDKPYAYHKPSDDGMERINLLREHFSAGERLINKVCHDPRRRAIAITQNEQTAMWAIKAVVFSDEGAVAEYPDTRKSVSVEDVMSPEDKAKLR